MFYKSNHSLTLISFFNQSESEETIAIADAVITQLALPLTIYNGRLVVIMNEVSRALGMEQRDFAKNYVFTGVASTISGHYLLLRGKQLSSFKQAYLRQNGKTLAHVKALYIADIAMLVSYIAGKVKDEDLYDSFYNRVEQLVDSGAFLDEEWGEAA
ncbi:MAG TPA: hypothetical protein V6D10_17470 [Trichocoleus sp.]|jgi:hypothetical protein